MELNLDLNKKYTYADYLTWLDDKRRELINGFIRMMTPAPRRIHQKISSNLLVEIKQYLKNGKCEVYHAPFDVRLVETDKGDKKIENVVQPDIAVICDLSKLDERGCLGAPDFIIEIVSPSSSKTDLKDKYQLYEKFGVKEYWIVHPDSQAVYQYVLNAKGKYEQHDIYVKEDEISPYILPDLKIDLNYVFED
jgi:Uma2 family endonuclease